MKDGQKSLLGYLPAQVIKCTLDGEIGENKSYPYSIAMNTVSLFADISGFTKLSEKFSKKGRAGPEFLAFCLNRYMEQLSTNGGDIFKFAGDALLVIWPEPKDKNLREPCRKALQCAKSIMKKLHKLDMGSGNPLSVKVGLGVGACQILFVGGTFNRSEFLIVGTAMKQACSSECHCTEGGQIVVSEKVFNEIEPYYNTEKCGIDKEHSDSNDMDYYFIKESKSKERLKATADADLLRKDFPKDKIAEKMGILRTFIPAAVTNYLDIEMENWCKELRNLTIMFLKVSVGLSDTETNEGREKIQNVIMTVQRCVYCTRGSLNKFLMDDKGSVIVNVWGLPPFSSSDDPVRAVMSSILIVNELQKKYQVDARIGITTGCCFSGVCGCSGGRREYSILGEIVNLSARFMQTAIKIYDDNKDRPEYANHKSKKSIFLCEKTKNLIQNKIACEYRLNQELKGFSVSFDHFSPIEEETKSLTEDEIYKLIKTHRNNTRLNDYFNYKENENKEEKPIGLEKEKTHVKKIFDEVLTGESKAILIKGMIGSGKSLFVRDTLLSIINSKAESFVNLDKTVFISNQSPITHTIRMNGFRDSMMKMFKILLTINNTERTKYQLGDNGLIVEGDAIFRMIIKSHNYVNIKFIEEILDYDLSKHFEYVSNNQDNGRKIEITPLEKAGDPFFFDRNYEKNKTELAEFFFQLTVKYQKHVLKDKPLVFVVEDCQKLDVLSVEYIKTYLRHLRDKKLKKTLLLCTFQTTICSLRDIEKEKAYKLNTEFEESFHKEGGKIIEMKQFTDFENIKTLLKFNITKMMRGDIRGITDPKSLYEDVHIDEIVDDVIRALLPLTLKGNPLFLIELTQSLLDKNLLVLQNNSYLTISDEFKVMLQYKDYSNITIPFFIEKVLGNLIDSLKCTEIIILKHASVIGNIFDLDTLSSIISFPSITFDDLFEMIKNFESLGILEILYDIKPKHLVAMFAIPLLREILYQRMLVEQKTDIHNDVATRMQFTKFSYMPKEQENAILQRHLETGEKTIMNHLEDEEKAKRELNNVNLKNQKILTTKEIIEKLKIIDLKINSSYSNVKNQSMPMILSANIVKKDEHGGKVEERYAVLTNVQLCYYYYESNYNEKKAPLASFFLKNIYEITLLSNEQDTNDKKYYMEIKVSSWYKKDIAKEDRTFIIGFDTKEELYKWEISLNFLRIKNMYDEFTKNFGMIQLPLNNEFSALGKKKYKRKLNIKANSKLSNVGGGIVMNRPKNAVIRKKTISNINTAMVPEQEKIETDKQNLKIVNENVQSIIFNGLGLFFGKIQGVLYSQNIDLFYCPDHLAACNRDLKLSKYNRFKNYTKANYKDGCTEENESVSCSNH